MIKKILFCILLLGFTVFSYADEERIVGLESDNTSVVAEELQSLTIANQIQKAGELDAKSTKVTNVSSPTASTDASTKGYVDTQITTLTASSLLTGEIRMYGGSTAPTGWLVCDGSAVSRTTYSALFAIIGTTYGIGDNSTTFNLPNFTSKMVRGNTPGTGGGSDTFSLTIAEANLPSHTHTGPSHSHAAGTLTGGAHTHTIGWTTLQSGSTNTRVDGRADDGEDNQTKTSSSNGAVAVTGSTGAEGTGATGAIGSGTAKSIDTLPAYTAVKFIIKTGRIRYF